MPPQEKFETPVRMDKGRESNTAVCQNSLNLEVPGSNQNNKETDEARDMDFDDLLPYVGEFGLYQRILFILMIPFASFVAWVYFSQIFITLIPDEHWCWVPELENLTADQRYTICLSFTAISSVSQPLTRSPRDGLLHNLSLAVRIC